VKRIVGEIDARHHMAGMERNLLRSLKKLMGLRSKTFRPTTSMGIITSGMILIASRVYRSANSPERQTPTPEGRRWRSPQKS
jgi:hypothetical protein